jgi:hypothetical protein
LSGLRQRLRSGARVALDFCAVTSGLACDLGVGPCLPSANIFGFQAQLANDWALGSKLVVSGEKRVESGQGELERGQQEIAEGTKLMQESERLFREKFPQLKLKEEK